jgi:hypothetical protein
VIARQCIDPNGGYSRSLENVMQNKKLVALRMNEVNALER